MSDQGSVYAAHVAGLLDVERKRAERLDTRGAAVTTSSSAIIALIAAAAALIVGKDWQVKTELSKWGVLLALALLITAGIFALVSGQLRKYVVPSDNTLRAMGGSQWTDSEVSARLATIWMNLDTLISLREADKKRSYWLERALMSQLAGGMLLAISLGWELLNRL